MISHRYVKANLPQLPNYDRAKANQHLIYWDANSLYGWAMSQPLPTGGFKWLMDKEIDSFDVHFVYEDSEVGYILEVDLGMFYKLKVHGNLYKV